METFPMNYRSTGGIAGNRQQQRNLFTENVFYNTSKYLKKL